MKDKILALLTAVFAGVRKDGLQQPARILVLQATTEEEPKARNKTVFGKRSLIQLKIKEDGT